MVRSNSLPLSLSFIPFHSRVSCIEVFDVVHTLSSNFCQEMVFSGLIHTMAEVATVPYGRQNGIIEAVYGSIETMNDTQGNSDIWN